MAGKAVAGMSREWSVGNTGWQTPCDVFDRIAAEFGPFDLDPASARGAYSSQHVGLFCTPDGTFFSVGLGVRLSEDDGMVRPWHGKVFVNPPYRQVEAWVKRGSESAKAGATVVMLLIPSTDARWFGRYVWDRRLHRPREGVECRFLEGRIRFVHPDPEKRLTDFKGFRPISGNMLVIFHPPLEAK